MLLKIGFFEFLIYKSLRICLQIRQGISVAGQVEERKEKDESEEAHVESGVQRDTEGKLS